MHGNLEGYVTWCAWTMLYQIYVDILAYNVSNYDASSYTWNGIDDMFMKELTSIVNYESEMVIFIDIDQNSIPNSLCVYSFTKRDLLG